jgi:dihydrofolate synthase/folylpolyglutamate synthase
MNYQETLDFMFNSLPMFQRQGKAAYKSNLDNSIAFDQHLNHPHQIYKTIHIAGTNGKGSSSHMLASILQEAGYKVGLYTSPHLKDFRERIKINGQMVSEQFVVNFIQNNNDFINKLKPSFFEMTVFMAFEFFKHEKVDIAVIETGMGGRLDSTNLIQPLVSVITNISLDHMQFLGNTIEKIAIEKAGIIKDNTAVIIGESNKEYDTIFLNKAKEKNSSCDFSNQSYSIPYALNNINSTQSFDVYKNGEKKYKKLELDLLGQYQQKNVLTVLNTVEHIQIQAELKISEKDIYLGLKNVVKNTQLLGRWQNIGNNPQIICDTGHNEAGVKLVFDQIKNTAYDKLHIVWGMVNDKSIDKIMALLPKNAVYYFTKASIPRALNEEELYKIAKKHNLKGQTFTTVERALKSAKLTANQNDLIFIGGSTFVVAEVV